MARTNNKTTIPPPRSLPPPPYKPITVRDVTKPIIKTPVQKESVVGNLLGSVVSGFGFGAGSEIARKVTNEIFENKKETVKTKTPEEIKSEIDDSNCREMSRILKECIDKQNTDFTTNCDDIFKRFSTYCI
jgi:hypothetical protein